MSWTAIKMKESIYDQNDGWVYDSRECWKDADKGEIALMNRINKRESNLRS